MSFLWYNLATALIPEYVITAFLIALSCIVLNFIINKLAEMPGVARVDHRTKCVSLVAISLSQTFETHNCWPA
jgi:hypothetical protein